MEDNSLKKFAFKIGGDKMGLLFDPAENPPIFDVPPLVFNEEE
jgi:hypothetical protein